jgi:hypothetical protein
MDPSVPNRPGLIGSRPPPPPSGLAVLARVLRLGKKDLDLTG